MLDTIQSAIGRPIEGVGTVVDLNCVSGRMIEDSRKLSRLYRMAYFRHAVARSEHSWIPLFISQCVEEGAEVATWGRGRVVSCDHHDLLFSTPLSDVLESMTSLCDGDVELLAPNPDSRFMRGAPAVSLPNVDYRWYPPQNMVAYSWGVVETVATSDPLLGCRRWLTTLLHSRAGKFEHLGTDPRSALNQLVPSTESFSADAFAAMRAYLVLQQSSTAAEPFGATGPDELFRVTPADLKRASG